LAVIDTYYYCFGRDRIPIIITLVWTSSRRCSRVSGSPRVLSCVSCGCRNLTAAKEAGAASERVTGMAAQPTKSRAYWAHRPAARQGGGGACAAKPTDPDKGELRGNANRHSCPAFRTGKGSQLDAVTSRACRRCVVGPAAPARSLTGAPFAQLWLPQSECNLRLYVLLVCSGELN
jgi:hypothetical protein